MRTLAPKEASFSIIQQLSSQVDKIYFVSAHFARWQFNWVCGCMLWRELRTVVVKEREEFQNTTSRLWEPPKIPYTPPPLEIRCLTLLFPLLLPVFGSLSLSLFVSLFFLVLSIFLSENCQRTETRHMEILPVFNCERSFPLSTHNTRSPTCAHSAVFTFYQFFPSFEVCGCFVNGARSSSYITFVVIPFNFIS